MGEAVRLAFTNYAIFKGRTSRANYWYFYLFSVLLNIPAAIIDRVVFNGHAYVSNLSGLFLIIPIISAGVRRMHDIDRRGWWLLFPLVNIYLLCQPSGPMNRFDQVI